MGSTSEISAAPTTAEANEQSRLRVRDLWTVTTTWRTSATSSRWAYSELVLPGARGFCVMEIWGPTASSDLAGGICNTPIPAPTATTAAAGNTAARASARSASLKRRSAAIRPIPLYAPSPTGDRPYRLSCNDLQYTARVSTKFLEGGPGTGRRTRFRARAKRQLFGETSPLPLGEGKAPAHRGQGGASGRMARPGPQLGARTYPGNEKGVTVINVYL